MIKIPDFKNIEEMQNFLNQEKEKGAVIIQPSDLTPVSYYRPVIEAVMLDEDDVYSAQNKFRIKFSGLVKLGNAAGVEWLPEETCRTDNRSDKMYVSFRAVGGIRKNDGRLYPMKAEYDLDLEIIEEEIRQQYLNKRGQQHKSEKEFQQYVEYCTKRDVIQKRKRKLTLAESGAKARVLRALLGIQNQYSRKNQIIGVPFLVVRFILDHHNPDIKHLFLKVAERSMCGLYGSAPAPVKAIPAAADDIIDIDTAPPTEREQFLAYDADTQGSILSQIAHRKGYDINGYCERAQVAGPEHLAMEKRIQFYDFLMDMEG